MNMVHYYCITHILYCLYMVATFSVANLLYSIDLQYNIELQLKKDRETKHPSRFFSFEYAFPVNTSTF